MSYTNIIQLQDEGQLQKDNIYSFSVDVQAAVFSDQNPNLSWIQAIPEGKYNHPVHGPLDFNISKLEGMAKTLNEDFRGIEVNIDYDHVKGIAAGWVKGAKVLTDTAKKGLWVLIEWTDKAAAHIKAREYKYFSPEIWKVWTHPTTGKKFNDAFVGGGITNRPFLKGIQEISLSEERNNLMTREQMLALAKALGIKLSDDITDEQLAVKLSEHKVIEVDVDAAALEAAKKKLTEDGWVKKEKEVDSKIDPDLIKLAETNPAIAKLVEDLKASNKRMEMLERATNAAAVKLQLADLNTENYALAPVHAAKLQELMIKVNPETATELYKFTEGLMSDNGIVQLGEQGSTTDVDLKLDGKTAFEAFDAKINSILKANDGTMTYSEASIQAASSNPALYEAYEKESYSSTEEGI